MKLAFLYTPVADIKEALAFYRDVLGFEELWREGDSTVALKFAGSDAAILLDQDPSEGPAGGFFVIDSVREFYDKHSGMLKFRAEPHEIPPGLYAAFEDPFGNLIRVMDRTKDNS